MTLAFARPGSATLEVNAPLVARSVDGDLAIVGRIHGAMTGTEVLPRQAAIDAILAASSPEALTGILRQAMGAFAVVWASRGRIWTAPAHPGLYYRAGGGRFSCAEDPWDLYGPDAAGRLNTLEVVNCLLSHNGMRPPFTTLVDDVRLAPGGMGLTVGADGTVTAASYLMRPGALTGALWRSDAEGYRRFAHLLESSLGLIGAALPADRPAMLYLSGGIDSSVLLLALVRMGVPLHALYLRMSWPFFGCLGKSLADHWGVPFHALAAPEPTGMPAEDVDRMFDLMRRYPGIPVESELFALGGFVRDRGLDGSHLISGQNLDSAYVVEGFRLDYASRPLADYRAELSKTRESRQRFAEAGLTALLDQDRATASDSVPMGYRFLRAMAVPFHEHVDPGGPAVPVPPLLESVVPEVKAHKEATILGPLLGGPDDYRRMVRNGLTVRDLNHLVRIVKFYRFCQSPIHALKRTRRTVGIEADLIATEGPLLHYFLDFMTGDREVAFPKSMMFDYFRDHHGQDFFDFRDGVVAMLKRRPAHAATPAGPPAPEPPAGDFRARLCQTVDPDQSRLVAAVDNPRVRDFLAGLGRLAAREESLMTQVHHRRMVTRFAAMELFLRRLAGRET